jgi:catechol 2,3-dioxygenase-like lactoylglutathione lyase family enzyme
MANQDKPRPRMVGINHVALEVGNIEAALNFYGSLFSFTLRGRGEGMAFIDMGDQFLALAETGQQAPDRHRHFGLVVDDRSSLRTRLKELQVELLPGKGLNFRDPWGNFVQVVEYGDIQFSKTDAVMKAMTLELAKSDEALDQLKAKGMA